MIESFVILKYFLSIGSLAIDPIDQTFVEIPASALGEYSPSQNYSGEFHVDFPVTINLSYSLGCSPPNYKLCTVNTVLQCVREYECTNGRS